MKPGTILAGQKRKLATEVSRQRSRVLEHLAMGAAAGVVGTILLQVLRSASQKWLPQTIPPIRQDPGEFMVEKAEKALPKRAAKMLPSTAESAAAQALGVGYGMTFGVLYAAIRGGGGPAVRDGILLGLATWAAGYLGWLPAAGLMPAVWKQSWVQSLPPAVQHALFGIATVAGYDVMHNKMHHHNGRHGVMN